MQVDLKNLIRKLNRHGTRALEAAAGNCVSRGHYEVTVEHVLMAALEDPSGDIQQILRHFEIDVAPVLTALQRSLENLKAGSGGKPVFSPILVEWVRDAWLLTSVDYQDSQMRTGALFTAIVQRPGRYAGAEVEEHLGGIRTDELRRDLYKITSGSSEAVAAAEAEAAGERPARPHEETAIGKFCIDFTEKARNGEVDPVFGRDEEIRQMVDILARRRKNNPIVVGEPGVGKTAVVEGLALRIARGDVPDLLKNVRLVSLDMGLLQAGAGVKGEFENRLKNVINEIKGSPTPMITFIDEAHTLIGAGGQAGGGDAANLLKPALARGELRTVAATTWSEYKKYFEKDAALERRFQLVKLDEPSVDTAVTILRGLRDTYEKAHGVQILEEAVEAAATLSSRYLAGRQLPDKAVDLLDTSCARVKIAQAAKPAEIDDLERQMQSAEREQGAIERDAEMGAPIDKDRLAEVKAEIKALQKEHVAATKRWEKEREAFDKVKEIRDQLAGEEEEGAEEAAEEAAEDGDDGKAKKKAPAKKAPAKKDTKALEKDLKKAMTALKKVQGDDRLIPLEVDARVVGDVVSSWTGVPAGKMMGDQATQVLEFRENMAKRIKGQDQALDAVDKGMRAARSGLKDPGLPIGVFLFVGPSGVGKTETATVVADLMFGGERFLTSINMSEFQEKHTISRLVGSPPGYVGYGEGGVLTEAVRQRPYSVVLLDEVEKADLEVMNLFYQVFDKGSLSDGEGREIDFKNTVMFLTSNLATDTLTKLGTQPVRPTPEELAAAIRPELSKHFKPALLGRMEIVPFYPLAPEFLKEITRIKLSKIARRLQDSHKMELVIDDEVVDLVAQRCTEVETGARNIDHIIRQTLLPMLSNALLERMTEGPLPGGVKLEVDDDESFELTFLEEGA